MRKLKVKTICASDWLWEQVKEAAKVEGMSISQFVRECIRARLLNSMKAKPDDMEITAPLLLLKDCYPEHSCTPPS